MYFGKTDLPVYKVFGAKGESDTTWEYLKSASEFKQEKLDKILEKKPPDDWCQDEREENQEILLDDIPLYHGR